MSDVLGTAWVEIRAKLDKFSQDMSSGVQNQIGNTANKAAQSVARSSQVADAALKANAANIKTIDTVSKSAAAAQEKLAAAQASAAATAEKYGQNSAQARAATLQQASAQRDLDKALLSVNDKTSKLGQVSRNTGRAAGAMFGVLVQNSQGALGPIQEVYSKLQGVGSALEEGRSRAGKWAVGIGAAATGVGTVLGTISSKEVGAQNALKSALAGTGHSWDQYSKQIEENVKRGEHFGNTAATTMTVLNRLTLATHSPDAAMKTYQSTLNLAAARHIPVERAAILMGRAINGNTTGLSAFGIQVQSTTKLMTSQQAATKAHATAVDALKKAQEGLRDTEARLRDSHKSTGASASTLATASLSVESAQNTLKSAMDRYGPGTVQASMAQQRLALAQGRYNDALNKGHGSTALSVSQQITLRHAQEALRAAQEKVTKTAQEQTRAHHDLAKAGSTVDQINKQVSKFMGGQASAQANTFTGHLHALAAVVDDNVAKFGGKLFPTLVTAGPLLMGVGAIMETGIIGKFGSATKTALGFANAEGEVSKFSIRNVAVQVANGAKTAAIWVAQTAKVIAFRAASIAVATAQKLQAAAQWALNAAMDANPIGLAIVAIAALAAGIIFAYKHSQTFRDIVHDAFHVVGDAVDWVRDHWKIFFTIFMGALGPLGIAIALIVTHFSTFKTIALDAFKWVANAFLTLVGSIIDGAASAFGWVPGLGGKLKGAARTFDNFRDDVNAALNGIGDKTVHISAVAEGNYLKDPAFAKFAKQAVSTFTAADWKRIEATSKKASGGMVGGVGGPRDDNQLHWLSPGEYVVNAHATRRHRMLLEAINGHGYADGGLIPSINTSQALSVVRAQAAGTGAYTSGIADVIGSRASVLAGLVHHVNRGRAATGDLARMVPAGSRAALIDRALALAGAASSSGNEAAVNLIVTNESGWNRHAINNWDINAQRGDPSRGLMQTIGSTFEAYRLKSLPDDIYNAVANLVAGIRYAMSRYGSLLNVPGVRSVAHGGSYVGYAGGGRLPAGKIVGVNTRTGQGITLNENGQEWVIPDSLMPSMAQLQSAINSPEGGIGALMNTYQSAQTRLSSAQRAASHAAHRWMPYQRRISRDDRQAERLASQIDAITRREHQISNSNAPTYIKNRELKALREHASTLRDHEKALKSDEAGIKKHEAALKKAYDTTQRALAAAKKASKDAADAVRQQVLQSAATMASNFRQAGTANLGLSDIFHYQAGYGAGGISGAIAMIRQRIRDMRVFGGLLMRLAKKGLQPDMINELIQLGPQAGISMANQLLSDPTSLTTLEDLEKQLGDITASIGGSVAATAYHIAQPAQHRIRNAHHLPRHSTHRPHPRPTGREYLRAGSDGALLVVHGDFIIRNESDLARLQSMLYTASASTTRATGTTRT